MSTSSILIFLANVFFFLCVCEKVNLIGYCLFFSCTNIVIIIAKYRGVHHINDEQHKLALAKSGWTPEEFQVGHRFVADNELGDDDDEWVGEEGPIGHELKRKVTRLARGLVR